jgi:hypothetical protein
MTNKNTKYEIVQTHEYQDIYRITDGVLLKINKFKNTNTSPYWYRSSTEKYKKQLKKVSGIKQCYILKEDINLIWCEYGRTVPKGTVIFEYCDVQPLGISEKDKWFYELKTTSSAFSGNLKKFKELIEMVNEILESY